MQQEALRIMDSLSEPIESHGGVFELLFGMTYSVDSQMNKLGFPTKPSPRRDMAFGGHL